MDLRDNPAEQLDSIEKFLRDFAESSSPPSVEMWQERMEAHVEVADFLARYVTPKVRRLLNGERLTLRAPVPRVATFENGAPSTNMIHVGVAGADEMRDYDNQVGHESR